jgi:Starch synthase catalytic domain
MHALWNRNLGVSRVVEAAGLAARPDCCKRLPPGRLAIGRGVPVGICDVSHTRRGMCLALSDATMSMDAAAPRCGGGAMYVVMVAAECAPAAKAGGLGDVVSGLSRELERLGHAVEIIVPTTSAIRAPAASTCCGPPGWAAPTISWTPPGSAMMSATAG